MDTRPQIVVENLRDHGTQWRSEASVKTTSACPAQGCTRVTHSPRRCFTSAHACSNSVVHVADVIHCAVGARLGLPMTLWRKASIRLQGGAFTVAGTGKRVCIQFTAIKKCCSSHPVPGRRRDSRSLIRAGSCLTPDAEYSSPHQLKLP